MYGIFPGFGLVWVFLLSWVWGDLVSALESKENQGVRSPTKKDLPVCASPGNIHKGSRFRSLQFKVNK